MADDSLTREERLVYSYARLVGKAFTKDEICKIMGSSDASVALHSLVKKGKLRVMLLFGKPPKTVYRVNE